MMTKSDHPRWGAYLNGNGAEFGLWAPSQPEVWVRAGGRDVPMQRSAEGWFTATIPDLGPGDAYCYKLEDGRTVPDPAARAQKDDVHGPSLLVDTASYDWQYHWQGRPWEEAVIYEIHVGTFTEAGTFRAMIDRLPALADLGITAIELMPIAQFAGNRGWGYDGVLPYAVHPAYGTPEDLRALVDAAHGQGLMVLLDVVYNHFGPEGNHLSDYAPEFFHPDCHTPWGAAIAYERAPVRNFFIDNALHWLREYNLDGLRLDAIDHIHDPSDPDLLVELAMAVRTEFPERKIHLTTEDNRNITRLHERDGDQVPLYTAEWNDDWHNTAHVIATGETEFYYVDFADDPQAHLARTLAEGFAFQGEFSQLKGEPRGKPSAHLPPLAFVDFLQNHDQVGNRAYGERIDRLAEDRAVQALHAILLLSPHIPLLFMGEEYGETRPFLFFTDFHGELADAVREGRRREFAGFGAFTDASAPLPDPNAWETFEASRLDWSEREGSGYVRLGEIRELLALRATEIVPYLAGVGGQSGRMLESEPDVVAVDWHLNGTVLHLRANLGEHVRSVPAAPGRTIWGSGGDSFGPWQVHVTKAHR